MPKKKKSVNRVEKRWEDGVPHDPRSEELYQALAKLDLEEGGDSLQLKSGGDGDIGENLMYLLDVYFEDKDLLTGPTEKLTASLRTALQVCCDLPSDADDQKLVETVAQAFTDALRWRKSKKL